jgi:hypothetical protein
MKPKRHTRSDNKVRELIAEYHWGRLQSTPLGTLCTAAGAYSTLQNNFGTVFVECLQSCPRITPDVINIIKMPSF